MKSPLLLCLLFLTTPLLSSAGTQYSYTTLSILQDGNLNPAVTAVVCILVVIACVLVATYVYWPVQRREQ